MMIDLGEAEVFKGKVSQTGEGLIGRESVIANRLEQLSKCLRIYSSDDVRLRFSRTCVRLSRVCAGGALRLAEVCRRGFLLHQLQRNPIRFGNLPAIQVLWTKIR